LRLFEAVPLAYAEIRQCPDCRPLLHRDGNERKPDFCDSAALQRWPVMSR
jgi:hypothetical protein